MLFLLKLQKIQAFVFADNIRSFILGMIESTPRSRPVIVAAYQMPERYAITMYVSGLTDLLSTGLSMGLKKVPNN